MPAPAGHPPGELRLNDPRPVAAAAGDLDRAWSLVEQMERRGIQADAHTVCIMLMVLQQSRCAPKDVHRAFQLPEHLGIDICSRAILLCVAIKTCIQYKEVSRLENIISTWEISELQPCHRVYVALIRAYSFLQNVERCKDLWRQMIEERGMAPNCIVLGSMLHALVCANLVNDAFALFKRFRNLSRLNVVIYATLLRGLATQGRAAEAMELFREIRSEPGQALNVRLYNPLLDAHSRIGAVAEVHRLLKTMAADGVEPDSTSYAILVKAYCASGQLDQAVEVVCNSGVESMPKHCSNHHFVGTALLCSELRSSQQATQSSPAVKTAQLRFGTWPPRR